MSADLEWEVRHRQSSIYKGRGYTPQEALTDLIASFEKGLAAARDEEERAQKRLDKLRTLATETATAVDTEKEPDTTDKT